MEGIFAIYKDKGPTSNGILKQLKKITGIKKIGHAGTLDPLAQGVLIVGIGRSATRLLGFLVKKEKEYIADIKLGVNSTTDDKEGEKTVIEITSKPSLEKIKKLIPEFEGLVWQTPPIYSAVKIKGEEAYKLARRGQVPEISSRQVEIKKIEILKYQWPKLRLKVLTGPGVYIRSLARDIGQRLKTGGYLTFLERTRVGDFSRDQALSLEQFKKLYGDNK